jgi:hypothetical protein
VGDVAAHALADAGRRAMVGLKQFLATAPGSPFAASSDVVAKATT